jgi:hypothetical protein
MHPSLDKATVRGFEERPDGRKGQFCRLNGDPLSLPLSAKRGIVACLDCRRQWSALKTILKNSSKVRREP